VTTTVQKWVERSLPNNGFGLVGDDINDWFVCMNEYSVSARRPQLHVEYTLCNCLTSVSVSVSLDGTIGFDNNIEGGPTNETEIGWQITEGLIEGGSGEDLKDGIFRFDVAPVPSPARIVTAKFSLNSRDSSNSDFFVHEIIVDYNYSAQCTGSPFQGSTSAGCLREGENITPAVAFFGSKDLLRLAKRGD